MLAVFSGYAKRKDFHFLQNYSTMTDLLICIDNTASCLVIFNSEEIDVMLEKF